MSIFCCCTPIVLLPPSALFACARPPLCFSSRAHCPHCREIHDRGLLLCDLHHLLDTAGGGCTCFVRTSICVTVRHSVSPCICVTVRHSASPCVTCVTLCLRAITWSRYKLPPLALATSSRQIAHPITSTLLALATSSRQITHPITSTLLALATSSRQIAHPVTSTLLALATSSRQTHQTHLTPSHRRLIDRHLLLPQHRPLKDISVVLKHSLRLTRRHAHYHLIQSSLP
jgi:hypothetical protein